MPKKSFTFQKRVRSAATMTSPDISQFIAGHAAQITRSHRVTQESFLRVKIEAVKRGIPASRLWGEIVDAY